MLWHHELRNYKFASESLSTRPMMAMNCSSPLIIWLNGVWPCCCSYIRKSCLHHCPLGLIQLSLKWASVWHLIAPCIIHMAPLTSVRAYFQRLIPQDDKGIPLDGPVKSNLKWMVCWRHAPCRINPYALPSCHKYSQTEKLAPAQSALSSTWIGRPPLDETAEPH